MSAIRRLIDRHRGVFGWEHGADDAEAELKELEQVREDARELVRVARIRGDERVERDRADAELLGPGGIIWRYNHAQPWLSEEQKANDLIRDLKRWAAARGAK